MIDIMDLSPSKAIEVFTHSAANIATQAFMIENSGEARKI